MPIRRSLWQLGRAPAPLREAALPSEALPEDISSPRRRSCPARGTAILPLRACDHHFLASRCASSSASFTGSSAAIASSR